MDFFRDLLDDFYDSLRDSIFAKTEDDPEKAHDKFVKTTRGLHKFGFGLEKILLNCSENKIYPGFEISNAAGFNKNGDIPTSFLRYLGFDRVVIGTVTAEYWAGNERPRIKRYSGMESIVNWMGLPGVGAEKVAENLTNFGRAMMPITINLMATPGKKGDELLEDIGNTIMLLRDFPSVDRFELNISCPNTYSISGTIDAREEYQRKMVSMVDIVNYFKKTAQDVYLKVSPDLRVSEIQNIVNICHDLNVCGITVGNTTTNYDNRFVSNNEKKGGLSGRGLYERSLITQKNFEDYILWRCYNKEIGLIACGGIDSLEKAKQRTENDIVFGIQIYTPLIFKGPKLLRELRSS